MDQLRAQCDLLVSLAATRDSSDVRAACDAVARAVAQLRAANPVDPNAARARERGDLGSLSPPPPPPGADNGGGGSGSDGNTGSATDPSAVQRALQLRAAAMGDTSAIGAGASGSNNDNENGSGVPSTKPRSGTVGRTAQWSSDADARTVRARAATSAVPPAGIHPLGGPLGGPDSLATAVRGTRSDTVTGGGPRFGGGAGGVSDTIPEADGEDGDDTYSSSSAAAAGRARFVSGVDEADIPMMVEATVDNATRLPSDRFVSLPREPFRRALATPSGRRSLCHAMNDLRARQTVLAVSSASNLALAMMEGFDACLTAGDFSSARQLVHVCTSIRYEPSEDAPSKRLSSLVSAHVIYRDDNFWSESFRLAMLDHARRLSVSVDRESSAGNTSEMIAFGQLGCYVYDMASAGIEEAVIRKFLEARFEDYDVTPSHRELLLRTLEAKLAAGAEGPDADEEFADVPDIASPSATAAATESVGSLATASGSSLEDPSGGARKGKPFRGKGTKGIRVPVGDLRVRLFGGRSLPQRSNTFCVFKVKVPGSEAKTPASQTYKSQTAKQKSTDPEWDETFIFEINDPSSILQVKVWREERLGGRSLVGMADIPIDTLLDGFPRNEWHSLTGGARKKPKGDDQQGDDAGPGAIRVEVQYESKQRRPCNLARGTVVVKVVRGRGLAPRDRTGMSDPFAVVTVGKTRCKTRHISQTLDPVWGEEFIFEVLPSHTVIRCSVWDWDKVGASEFMGHAHIDLRELADEMPFISWVPLGIRANDGKNQSSVSGEVLIGAQYFPYEGGSVEESTTTLGSFFRTPLQFLSSKVAAHYFEKLLETEELATFDEFRALLRPASTKRTMGESDQADRMEALAAALEPARQRFDRSTLAADLLADITLSPAAKGNRLCFRRCLPTFHDLTESEYALKLFTEHITKEFSEENLEFYLEIENYRRLTGNAAAAKSAARRIYDTFVRTGSEREVNIESNLRDKVTEVIGPGVEFDTPPADVFDGVQAEVTALMEKGPLARFFNDPKRLSKVVAKLRSEEVADALQIAMPDLDTLLGDPTARAHLRRFLHWRFEGKYLRFLDACAELDQEKPFNVNHARQVYNRFIAGPEADNIGLSRGGSERVRMLIDSPSPPEHLFADAVAHARKVIEDRYDAFCRSNVGHKLALALGIFP